MRLHQTLSVAALAVLTAVSLSAQSGTVERTEKTKVEVKGGKDVTITGCLARSSGATDFVITSEAGSIKYAVVTDDDLGKYVDRRVEIKGKAADQGDGKIKVDRKVKGTTGDTADSKVERNGDTTVMPFLGLKSIKSVGQSCRY
jgi:hypothetical protein